jgi:phosphatidylinositol-3,4,5-trisphosphate 3-phosphatase/dual-specificity protein phosphatase PTEN
MASSQATATHVDHAGRNRALSENAIAAAEILLGLPAGSTAAAAGSGGGVMAEVQDKAGWVFKHSTGRSLLGRRNWTCRYVVSNVEGVSYFEKEPFTQAKGFIPWDRITHMYPVINSSIDPAANDPDMSYFGVRFIDAGAVSGASAAAERMLTFRVDTSEERTAWVEQMTAMAAEADKIRQLLDEDDDGGPDGGPKGRASRREDRKRGALLESIQTRLRTLVSLKKQRFVKDGIDLDLAYVGTRIIAMGFPSVGREAVFRNPMEEVLEFFRRYHGRNYRVYNLCSERAYPPSRFEGRFERFPFDDHNAPPLALMPAFVESALHFLSEGPHNVVAIHCKAGKGRTGVMVCCLLLAQGTCATAPEALAYFATHRTKDGKGVAIPSQKRFIAYYAEMLQRYNGLAPPAPRIRIESITLSSTPRFDPDGGCDPYVIVSRRRADHRHVPLGTNEALVTKPMEAVLDSRTISPPAHFINQRDVKLSLRNSELPGGELHIEVIDQDQLSKDDVMMGFWVHTGFLPLDGTLTLRKEELDDAVKDKKHELIDADFTLTLKYTFVAP